MYNLHIQMQLLLLGWKSRSQNACIRTAKESRNLKPQKKKKKSFHIPLTHSETDVHLSAVHVFKHK